MLPLLFAQRECPAQVVELQQKLAAAEERARQLEAAQKQLKERLAQAEQGLEVRPEPCACN